MEEFALGIASVFIFLIFLVTFFHAASSPHSIAVPLCWILSCLFVCLFFLLQTYPSIL